MPPPPPTSSGQHLLMPNRPPSTRNPYTVLVEVTSRDRNYKNQVKSNPVRFQFQRPLKDVKGIELISGTIPFSPWNINHDNEHFAFTEGDKTWNLKIPTGYYTADYLIYTLNLTLNLIDTLNTYSVTIDPATRRLNVVATTTLVNGVPLFPVVAPYAFLFESGAHEDVIDRSDGYFLQMNTIALMLGFDMSDYASCPVNQNIVSPYAVDHRTAMNRLYLYINFENSQNMGCIERGAGRRSPFAVIYLDKETDGYKFLNKETLTPASYSLPQPFTRLQNLQIEFRDEFYRLVNFDGKDFSLLFQITCLE